jgi:XTP/dITP diphosphohydrolase
MKKMLLASNNVGKQREIQSLLDDLDIELITPDNLGLHLEVLEDGTTYAENAARKAMAFARASGLVALADDSGLEVDALEGAPGLHSARYSLIAGATDADRRTLLLQQLQSHPRPWPARFRCVVALANPAGQVWFAEGECPGEIIPEERGHNGFGYDPIFLLPDLGLTMAELTLEQKNHLSHRSRAVTAARPVLLKLSSPAPH